MHKLPHLHSTQHNQDTIQIRAEALVYTYHSIHPGFPDPWSWLLLPNPLELKVFLPSLHQVFSCNHRSVDSAPLEASVRLLIRERQKCQFKERTVCFPVVRTFEICAAHLACGLQYTPLTTSTGSIFPFYSSRKGKRRVRVPPPPGFVH